MFNYGGHFYTCESGGWLIGVLAGHTNLINENSDKPWAMKDPVQLQCKS